MTTTEMFSERLKKLRTDKGKKRQEVADELAISRASLEYYEKGSRKPDIEILAKLAKYYNVSSDYLLGISDGTEINDDCKALERYLGLSEKAVKILSTSMNYNPAFRTINKFLNTLLEDEDTCDRIESFYISIAVVCEKYDDRIEGLKNLVEILKNTTPINISIDNGKNYDEFIKFTDCRCGLSYEDYLDFCKAKNEITLNEYKVQKAINRLLEKITNVVNEKYNISFDLAKKADIETSRINEAQLTDYEDMEMAIHRLSMP